MLSLESLRLVKDLLSKVHFVATSPTLADEAVAFAKLNREVDACIGAMTAAAGQANKPGPRIARDGE